MIVMSFGTLAVLGVQATLRTNGDIAKQRSEAVRIGQQTLERWRGFADLEGDDAQRLHFSDIADDESTVDGTNATYTVTVSVPPPIDDPRRRTVVVDVGWTDRGGQAQSIRLSSAIAGVDPAFAGTLALTSDGSVLKNPAGRHPGIPASAEPQEGGRSSFAPPGGGGVRWVFDNATGAIVETCSGDVCTAFNARLLSGFIRFSTGDTPDAEVPGSPRIAGVGVYVQQSEPAAVAGTVYCYEDTSATGYIAYYCAVPVGVMSAWSGRSLLSGLDLAHDREDGDADEFRVCRYTRYREHRSVPSGMRNEEHPRDYVGVSGPLTGQNFLVIRAGASDASPYDCPDDDPSTPLVNGTTWHHQPAS
ncbi:MAG: hypothetical protein Fur0014_03500 [Rubrivivax sp.]